MSDKAWKRWERKVADDWGGKRIPITGREEVDIQHPWLSIECKLRQSIPGWLKEAVSQAQSDNGKLPIVALKEHGGKEYVLMAKADFEEWFNPRGLPLSGSQAS